MEKKNIAIIAGGDSGEYEISIKSGEQLLKQIDKTKYNPYLIHIKGTNWEVSINEANKQVDKNEFTIPDGKNIRFDCALIAIHGTPGEDGRLQSYFEMMKLPYTTCGVLSSSLTFNKYACKHYLMPYGISTAKAMLFHKNEAIKNDEVIESLGLPCFVKPNNGGSSCGISKINKPEEIQPAIKTALKEDSEIIVEEYLKGTEITCGVMKTRNRSIVFPIAEIVSKKEFFDYEAKYTNGMADEIIPARIPEKIRLACEKMSSLIYDKLFCRGVVRIDYIIRDEQLYFLEVNTVPGMTENSIIPRMIKAAGLTMTEVLSDLIEDALSNGK
jgi:D-alanine-D-alanine ligase